MFGFLVSRWAVLWVWHLRRSFVHSDKFEGRLENRFVYFHRFRKRCQRYGDSVAWLRAADYRTWYNLLSCNILKFTRSILTTCATCMHIEENCSKRSTVAIVTKSSFFLSPLLRNAIPSVGLKYWKIQRESLSTFIIS